MDSKQLYKALDGSPELLDFIRRRSGQSLSPPTDPRDLFIWEAGRQSGFRELMSLYEAAENERRRTLGKKG